MASTDTSDLLLRVPLAEVVAASQLQDLLAGITALYDAASVLEAHDVSPEALSHAAYGEAADLDPLWIEELVIGTPNELKLRGKGQAILGVLTIAAAVLALPKLQAEAENTRANTAKTHVETVAGELELLEKAHRLHAEGKITKDQHDSVLRSLQIGKDALRNASGLVRDDMTTMDPKEFSRQKHMLRVLQRARALGVAEPTADMWIGLLSNDMEVMRRALDAGANPNRTYGEVLNDILPKVRDDQVFRETLASYLIAREAG